MITILKNHFRKMLICKNHTIILKHAKDLINKNKINKQIYFIDSMEGNGKEDNNIKSDSTKNEEKSTKSLLKEKLKTDKKANKKLAKAINVLNFHESGKDTNREIFSIEPTTNIWVYHFGNGDEDDQLTIKDYFSKIGECKVFMFPGISYGFIEFKNIDTAKAVITPNKDAKQFVHSAHDLKFQSGERKIFCFYSKINLSEVNENNNSTFPIANYKINVPGLYILDDFISTEEEEILVKNIDQNEWTKLSNRRVQHYGYEFIYGANNVNKNKKIGELPSFGSNLSQSKHYFYFRI